MKNILHLLSAALFITAAIPAQASAHISRTDSLFKESAWITAGKQGSMPAFRTAFSVGSPIPDLRLNCTALGIYDVTINGKHVDMGELNPGWTDYRKEVMSQEADITPYIHEGNNEIVIQLSRGWWGGGISRNAYGKDLDLCLRATVSTTDGKIIASTGPSWEYSVDGPLILGDIYNGEVVDARKKFNVWEAASVYDGAVPTVIPHEGPLVQVRDSILWRKPESAIVYRGNIAGDTQFGRINIVKEADSISWPLELKAGETALIDFGQNFAGIVEMQVMGDRGTTVTVSHGEMLNDTGDKDGRLDDGPAGSLWTYNLREAAASLRYTLAGEKACETVRPRHTFMGFRYVEIEASGDVTIASVTGKPMGADIVEHGRFECSDADINKLFSNTLWSQRSNFLSVPTDCPQRDERLGWTGDTQLFSRTAMYNSDAADFYKKWMRDMRNSQREDGAYPDIAPWANFWGYGTSAWGDAGVIVPWNVYEMTGDTSVLADNYESMSRWMDYLGTQVEDTDSVRWSHIGGGTATGDWLAYDPVDPRFVSMAYYVYVSDLMSNIARVLGKDDDSSRYAVLADDIRREFRDRYVNPDGSMRQTTQTAYLLALRHELLSDSLRGKAVEALCSKIRDNGYRLSTGFVGTPLLCSTLSDNDVDDMAYTLIQQRENPSWLYSIDQGATTIWERWDSYTREGGFHKHPWNMNSFNHYSYGAVVEWLYSYVGGIRPGAPGFSKVILAPRVDRRSDDLLSLNSQKRITWATASTVTPHGKVTSEWRRTPDGNYDFHFTLPRGLEYEVDIPGLTDRDRVKVDFIEP